MKPLRLLLLCLYASGALAAPTPALLQVLRDQPEQSWLKLNRNAFRAAWPPPALRPRPIPSVDNPANVIRAWGGFAWDPNRSELWLWGGGHADYAGNEVYRWRGATLRWERASLPSLLVLAAAPATYLTVDEAAPVSAHPYDTTEFLPGLDRLLVFGGGGFNNGREFVRRLPDGSLRRTGPWWFDPSRADANRTGAGMWNNRDLAARHPDFPILFRDAVAGLAREQGRDVVYVAAPPGLGSDQWLWRYRPGLAEAPDSDGWELAGRNGGSVGGQGAGAVHAGLDLFVRTGTAEFPLHFWPLRTAPALNRSRAVRAADLPGVQASGLVMQGRHGMEYDPVRQRLLLWEGGPRVWFLSGERGGRAWRAGLLPVRAPSGAPPQEGGVGVLGRWKYAADLDVFIALAEDGDVWAFKPEGWRPPKRP